MVIFPDFDPYPEILAWVDDISGESCIWHQNRNSDFEPGKAPVA